MTNDPHQPGPHRSPEGDPSAPESLIRDLTASEPMDELRRAMANREGDLFAAAHEHLSPGEAPKPIAIAEGKRTIPRWIGWGAPLATAAAILVVGVTILTQPVSTPQTPTGPLALADDAEQAARESAIAPMLSGQSTRSDRGGGGSGGIATAESFPEPAASPTGEIAPTSKFAGTLATRTSDINGDGTTDIRDAQALALLRSTGAAPDLRFDQDGDLAITQLDIDAIAMLAVALIPAPASGESTQ